jgi:serine/threonine protein kinase
MINSTSAENIGSQLSIFRNERLGAGRFGTVFPGQINKITEEVAIKKMQKEKVRVDSSLYLKLNECPNVVNYYGTHELKDDEFM